MGFVTVKLERSGQSDTAHMVLLWLGNVTVTSTRLACDTGLLSNTGSSEWVRVYGSACPSRVEKEITLSSSTNMFQRKRIFHHQFAADL